MLPHRASDQMPPVPQTRPCKGMRASSKQATRFTSHGLAPQVSDKSPRYSLISFLKTSVLIEDYKKLDIGNFIIFLLSLVQWSNCKMML